jgi:hypothetical protein
MSTVNLAAIEDRIWSFLKYNDVALEYIFAGNSLIPALNNISAYVFIINGSLLLGKSSFSLE